MSSEALPGAVCAKHPTEPIAFTCARCGSFRCEQCRMDADLCPDCAPRSLDPANVVFMSAVRDGVMLAFKQVGPLAPVIAFDALAHIMLGLLEQRWEPETPTGHPSLAVFAQGMLFRLGVLMVVSVAGAFVASAVDGIQLQNLADAARGSPRPLGEQAGLALKRYPQMLAMNLLTDMGSALLMMLCCVPAVLFTAVVSFTETEVVLGGQGVIAALRRSYRRALPMFWKLTLMIAVYFLADIVLAAGLAPLLKATLSQGAHTVVFEVITRTFVVSASLVLNAIVTLLYLRTRLAEAK